MKISVYGDKNNEKILLIHPMYTGEFFFEQCVRLLADKYCLLIPTLSGHYEGSVYESMEKEEAALDGFLRENGMEHLKAAAGFSLGGNILFDYFCKNTEKIDKLVVDSAPIFYFPKLIRAYFFRRYRKCLLAVKEAVKNQRPGDAAAELNKCFNGMGEVQKRTAPIVRTESLAGLIESCFLMGTPPLAEEEQRKITFVYGSRDIARLCIPRIKKYKNSRLLRLKGEGHCGYFMERTQDYVEKLIE